MTIFCGAISLRPNVSLPQDLLAALRANVSRAPADTQLEAQAAGFFVTHVDIGAFGAPGVERSANGSVTVIAGEPLTAECEGEMDWDRGRDLALLHPQLNAGSLAGLERCRGTFCGLHFNAADGSLQLFVDKMGVRPLYLWVGPGYAVFSSALRILEAMPMVDKGFDLRGVTEVATFGFSLADRTPYLGIKMLRSGEIVRVAGGQVERSLYARWDGPLDTATPHAQSVERAYEQFIKAIRRRHRDHTVAAAFLSGGLDSRVIVGGLHATGSNVYTVNYAPDGSQDQVFAALVAQKLGINYTQIETNAANVSQGYRKDEVGKWLKATFAGERTRAPLVWSGDGGSVALGHVYMTTPIVEAMNAGELDRATTTFTKGVAPGIFQRDARGEVVGLPMRGVKEELEQIDSADGGRRFHLFLMLNDQRRHLARHFEDIDLERIEFQLPFFDADFLDSVLRLPNQALMFHHFYMDWLARFPNGLDTIAWQAYPGHVPCELPTPPGLKYQWEEYYDKKMYRQMRVASSKLGISILRDARFPSHLVSRTSVAAAALLTGLGIRDYRYVIKTAAIYHRYWKNAQG
jgi:asparagine synthase (glutamine-hydrolysing)